MPGFLLLLLATSLYVVLAQPLTEDAQLPQQQWVPQTQGAPLASQWAPNLQPAVPQGTGAAPAGAQAPAAALPDWTQVALSLRSRADAVQQRVNAVRARLHVPDLQEEELMEDRPRQPQGQPATPAEPWDSSPHMRRGGHRRDRRKAHAEV